MLFYPGDQFPEKYQGGTFIAWHGSWNRAPLPQEGYKVTFTPFDGAQPSGDHGVFAGGFTGVDTLRAPATPSIGLQGSRWDRTVGSTYPTMRTAPSGASRMWARGRIDLTACG